MRIVIFLITMFTSTASFALPNCGPDVPIGGGCRFNCPSGISCGCGTKVGPNRNTLRLCPEDGGSEFKLSPGSFNDSGEPILEKKKLNSYSL